MKRCANGTIHITKMATPHKYGISFLKIFSRIRWLMTLGLDIRAKLGNLDETQDRFTEDNRGGVWHNKAPPMVT